MLSYVEGRRFTGRAGNHKAIRALADMELDQPPQHIVVNPVVLIERRDQGHNTAVKHGKSSPKTKHAMLLF
jgi:hypothetical protein